MIAKTFKRHELVNKELEEAADTFTKGYRATTDIIEDRPDLDDYRQSCSNLYGDVPEQPVEGTHTYAKRRVSELLAEQIECADVVVLTKVERVPLEQVDYIRALLHSLNPRSPVMVSKSSKSK